MRVVIASANDDQVLQPATDEQFAVLQKAQVAGAQERPGTAVLQIGFEGIGGFLGALPVSLGYAGPGDPDFAHLVGSCPGHRVGVGDQELLVEQIAPAADQRAGAGFVGQGIEHLVFFQGFAVERAADGRRRLEAAGDDQRGFGHAVAGIEGLAAETAGSEILGEAVERFGPHRLGAVKGQAPAAQVQRRALLGSDLVHAQVVGKVRSAADRAAIAGNCLQPAKRLLQERHRREQHVCLADIQRLQDAADQPHVVIAGQPENSAAATGVLEGIGDRRRIVHQIGMRQHHALGHARRPRRVLQKGQRIAVHVGRAPLRQRAEGQLVGRQPFDPLEPGRFREQRLHALEHLGRSQGHLGFGVFDDGLNPGKRTVSPRRIRRHRHHPGVQAPEKRDDEVQPCRIQQQGPLAFQPHGGQPGGNRASPLVELLIAQRQLFGFAVDQIGERSILPLMLRPVAQQIDKVRRSKKRPRQVIEMHGGPDSLSAEWLSDGLGLTERRPRWPTRYSIHFIGRRRRRAGSLIGEGGGSRSQNSRKDPGDGSSRRRGKKIGRHHRRNPHRPSKVPGLPIAFKPQKFPSAATAKAPGGSLVAAPPGPRGARQHPQKRLRASASGPHARHRSELQAPTPRRAMTPRRGTSTTPRRAGSGAVRPNPGPSCV